MVRRLVLLLATALTTASGANAQAIDGRATGVSGTLIDFNGLSVTGAPLLAVNGVAFTSGYVGAPGVFGSPFATNALYNFSPVNFVFGELRIRFGSAIEAASFNLVTDIGTSTFSAFLNDALVGTFQRPTDNTQSALFYGFENIQFDRLDVRFVLTGTTTLAFTGIDNLRYSGTTVPEPGSLALTVGGLAAVAGVLRRRRHAAHS